MILPSGNIAAAAPLATQPYPQSPDPTLPDPKWLRGLETHAIFSGNTSTNQTASLEAQNVVSPRQMAVRSTDLILVVDNQIRMASLLDAKATLSSQPMSPSPSSSTPNFSYKILEPTDASHIDYDIQHISVNPTGKLLAVVGPYTVSLLVLPRSGYNKQVGAEVSARSVPVGSYYHSAHALARIAKVQWHPWGEAGTSLLVLTEDGYLREYDVARDTEEPQQTVSLLPQSQPSGSSSLRSRARSATPTAASLAASILSSPAPFRNRSVRETSASPSRTRQGTPGPGLGFGLNAEDDDSSVAVSFALCISQAPASAPTMFDDTENEAWTAGAQRSQEAGDWSPFTVFGLMKNGDIWAVCPFMPRNSMIPPSFIHSLSRLTSLKLSSRTNNDEGSEAQLESEMQLRFLNALLKQVADKAGRLDPPNSRARTFATPGPERFGRERSTSTMDLDRLSEAPSGATADADDDSIDASHTVPLRLHPPSWAFAEDPAGTAGKNAPRPQGPFLLRPAPVELCDERESSACDMAWTWLDKRERSQDGSHVPGVGVLSVVGHDGRVDVGVLLEPVEAKWGKAVSPPSRKSANMARPVRSNRYGLSDTEDEGDESIALEFESLSINGSLPTLLVYETIDLGLLDSVTESSQSEQSASSDILLQQSCSYRPCFVADPLYRDTLYVYHALGAQCLGFAKWAGKLIDALNLPSEDDLGIRASSDGEAPIGREKALTKMLHSGDTTEVVWIVKTVASGDSGSLSTNPITAVCILSDVYLSYSLLAVTRDLQLVALELSLRIDTDELVVGNASLHQQDQIGADRVASSSGKPKAYLSLLGDGPPFTPPALFNQSGTLKGLPSQPRRAAASGTTPSSAEIRVTPDTLRQLGKTVETFRTEIRDVVQGGNAVQARLDLQVREMMRMLDKLDGIRKRCEKVSGASGGGLDARLARILDRQRELTNRTDKALQKLMDRHQPSLSVYEKRWFDELERIARDVGVPAGAAPGQTNGGPSKGLVAKSELLQHHLALLRPSLQAINASAANAPGKKATRDPFNEEAAVRTPRGIGKDQLKKVELQLSYEARLLAEAKNKVAELNGRVARASNAGEMAVGGRAWRVSGM